MANTDIKKLQAAIDANEKLYSVFDRITLGNARAKLNNTYEARVLTNANIVLPDEDKTAEQLKTELQNDLKADLSLLEKMSEAAQADTLPHLFQKYGWRIGDPDRTEDNELAVAYCDAFRLDKILSDYTNDQKFILLKGDLAGIQNYIYGNIQPKQAGGLRDIAKKLRGRSLIVSLLTDFLAGVILRELGLSAWHLLFAGGGHFNLLVPENKAQKLEEALKQIDGQIRERFGENLQLVVAYKAFEKQKIVGNPTVCFSEINRILEQKKLQPHKRLLKKHFEAQQKPSVDIAEEEKELGRIFPKQNLLIETFSTQPPKKSQTFSIFSIKASTGFHALYAAHELDDIEAFLLSNSEKEMKSTQVYALNNTGFLPSDEDWDYQKWGSVGFGFRLLGKTLPFDEEEERPKTFEEIVADDDNKLLAALRLDVDDLGFIFNQGMSNASLGEILTLSREMQYFFSAHFDRLAEKHKLYLIYSGGDDAFAVGKWDNVLHFAQELRTDFHKFVFQNPDVHFSAGVFMGNPHYPVGRFYLDAGQLQDMAKDAEQKNRIRVFNQTLGWEEFDSKIELGKTFAEALNPKIKTEENDLKKLPSAFAYRILNLVKSSFRERPIQDQAGNWHNRGSINPERFARNVAGLRYLFARHGFDQKRSEENVGKIERALIWDFMRSFDFGDGDKVGLVRDYLVALNYAIFKNRAQANQKS
ncbi:MAG: type III-A CRISPR-associated protein Cas10/Csm1 [Saprospiraceae bacterium]|nr:type III-A CRISPR-associated protein Cas10/Csm1 [Saprospiraceae bacterium]